MVENSDLLRSQKNSIFKMLERLELNPSEFKWIWDSKGLRYGACPVLEHKFDKYYFYFHMTTSTTDSSCIKCYPGHINPTETDPIKDWSRVLERVKVWAEDLKHELEQPDLWATAAHFDFNTLSYDQNAENTPFSYKEVEHISQKLLQLKEKVISIANECDVPKGKIDSINIILQRLEDSAKKGVGRIDWINQLVGLVINIAVVFSLNQESARQFFSFVKELFMKSLNILIP